MFAVLTAISPSPCPTLSNPIHLAGMEHLRLSNSQFQWAEGIQAAYGTMSLLSKEDQGNLSAADDADDEKFDAEVPNLDFTNIGSELLRAVYPMRSFFLSPVSDVLTSMTSVASFDFRTGRQDEADRWRFRDPVKRAYRHGYVAQPGNELEADGAPIDDDGAPKRIRRHATRPTDPVPEARDVISDVMVPLVASLELAAATVDPSIGFKITDCHSSMAFNNPMYLTGDCASHHLSADGISTPSCNSKQNWNSIWHDRVTSSPHIGNLPQSHHLRGSTDFYPSSWRRACNS